MAKEWITTFDEVRCTSFVFFLILCSWIIYTIFSSNFVLSDHPNLEYYIFSTTKSTTHQEFLNNLSIISIGVIGLVFLYVVQTLRRAMWHISHKPQNIYTLKQVFTLDRGWHILRWVMERILFTLILIINLVIVSYLIVVFGVNYFGSLWVGLTYYGTVKGVISLLK